LIPRLLTDPATRVLLLDGSRVPVLDSPDGVRLAFSDRARLAVADVVTGTLTGGEAHLGGGPLTAFLGQGPDGFAYLLAAAKTDTWSGIVPLNRGVRWAELRGIGHLLDDTGAGLFTTALAMANWHRAHTRCSRCGADTSPVAAGWARRCPECDVEHHPRTDPAVIMSVVDPGGRILLGRQRIWPVHRFSVLAGFVEPGESLEAAVRREVAEEAGVEVGEVTYLGSQPWPFPSSLMLGFTAEARTTEVRVDGVELAEARWWTREELANDLLGERVMLPPPVSIARRILEHWFGGELPGDGQRWR
jgi:NAD+ diphosphatase